MKTKMTLAATCLLAAAASSGQISPALAQANVVTIYSADGLHDGTPSWYGNQFDAFTKATGIKVQYVEAGSSGVVDRLAKEKSNTQADVLVTLPPFMQKAAADGLASTLCPDRGRQDRGARQGPEGRLRRPGQQLPRFHLQRPGLEGAAQDL